MKRPIRILLLLIFLVPFLVQANSVVLRSQNIGFGLKAIDADKAFSGLTIGEDYTLTFDVLFVNKPIWVSDGTTTFIVNSIGSFTVNFTAASATHMVNFFHVSFGSHARIEMDDLILTKSDEVTTTACVSLNNSDYRYAFNGLEKDDEVKKGKGNSYTTEFRQYDSRLGRWLSLDPMLKAHESPFVSHANNPLWFVDPNGKDTTRTASAGAEMDTYLNDQIAKTNRKGEVKTDKNGDPIMIENPNYDEAFHDLIDDMAKDPDVNVHFTTSYDDVKDLKKSDLSGQGGSIFFDGKGNYFVWWNPGVVDSKDFGASGVFEETYHMYDALYTENAKFVWDNDESNVAGWEATDEARAKLWVATEINPNNRYNTYGLYDNDAMGRPFKYGDAYTHYGFINKLNSDATLQSKIDGATILEKVTNMLVDGYLYQKVFETSSSRYTFENTYGGGAYSTFGRTSKTITR